MRRTWDERPSTSTGSLRTVEWAPRLCEGDAVRADERNDDVTKNEIDHNVEVLIDQLRDQLRDELRTELRGEMEQLRRDQQPVAARRSTSTSSRRHLLPPRRGQHRRRTGGSCGDGLTGQPQPTAPDRPEPGESPAPAPRPWRRAAAGEDAIYGKSTATTGVSWGVRGESGSLVGAGVVGIANSTSGIPMGVYGETRAPDGQGVFGSNGSSTGLSAGVHGETTSVNGAGVVGECAKPDAIGVWGKATTGTGVVGTSETGIGGRFSGVLSALRLGRSGNTPALRIDTHRAGEVYFDNANELWLCTQAGTPEAVDSTDGPAADPGEPLPRLRLSLRRRSDRHRPAAGGFGHRLHRPDNRRRGDRKDAGYPRGTIAGLRSTSPGHLDLAWSWSRLVAPGEKNRDRDQRLDDQLGGDRQRARQRHVRHARSAASHQGVRRRTIGIGNSLRRRHHRRHQVTLSAAASIDPALDTALATDRTGRCVGSAAHGASPVPT